MRTNVINDRHEIDCIIQQCDVCFVGMTGKDGFPYVIPMNFGYEEGELILHSGPEGKHIDLITNNNKVCITFCSGRQLRHQHPDVACSYSMESKSVVCQGNISFIDDDDLTEKERCMNIIMKNYTERSFTYSKPALRNVKVWKFSIDKITAKAFGQNFKSSF